MITDDVDNYLDTHPEAREALEAYASAIGRIDWRGFQQAMQAFQDSIRAKAAQFAEWWQQSDLARIGAALVEQERIQQRQRITAAKRRARIVTRAKAANARHTHA